MLLLLLLLLYIGCLGDYIVDISCFSTTSIIYTYAVSKDRNIHTALFKSLVNDADEDESDRSRRSFLVGISGMITATAAMTATATASASETTIKEQSSQSTLEPSILIQQQQQQKLEPPQTPKTSTTQESISGFFAGAALAGTKTFVKYPLDTATVRLQMPDTPYSIARPGALFDDAYRGIASPLLWNIPGGAVFFAVKDAVKSAIGLPKWQSTCVAVAVAQMPYWVIRNPSEVVKTKQQALLEGYENMTTWDAFNKEREDNGLSGFFTGYGENIAYAYPADVIKFLTYEQLTKGRSRSSALEGAVAGAIATAVAQFCTTPLDVVRNRVMAGQKDRDEGYLESIVTIAETEGLSGLFAGASPRVGKAFLSGAIQFATYEETKQQINAMFQRRG